LNLTVFPGYPLRGDLVLPGDKSLSHRTALFAALAEGESLIENFLVAGVTHALLNVLSDLRVAWELKGTSLMVNGCGMGGLRSPASPLDCGNSATTLRFLAGALAAAGIPAVLDGSPGLRRRPMKRIVEPLQQMGVKIESEAGGLAPLRLAGRPSGDRLHEIDYVSNVASAQVKTCLLLAALAAGGPSKFTEPALSRDHTERMLRGMGVRVESSLSENGASVLLTPPNPLLLNPLQMVLPGDFSSAAFFIVAALVTPGSEIVLREVGLNPTRTGLLENLLEMGADICVDLRGEQGGEPVGDIAVRYSSLQGTSISSPQVVGMIDEFPVFTIAAVYARGETVVKDATELRYKESDRISAICSQLRSLGVDIQETQDGYRLQGGTPTSGGTVAALGDHRLAMAFSVAGLAAAAPVVIEGAEIISESLPGFVSILRRLGAKVHSNE
jgi:3-phosphoshikimate 1-carboxyvinyltransferase